MTRHIGISLGLIDSLNDGLGEFATQLCTRFAAVAPAWAEDHDVRFHLHMPQRWHGRFGDDVGYLAARKSQGLLHWQGVRRFALWHGLNQLGRIGPPIGTRHGLLTIHDLNTLYHDEPSVIDRNLRRLRERLAKFDEVTTLTHHVEGDIRKHLNWAGQVTVIPNGARDLTRHARTAIHGLEASSYLFHLSRMAPSKNAHALLELAAAWPAQAIVLAGPPSTEAQALRAEGEARGLRNLQVIEGIDDAQKSWLYASCKAFLFPSLTEGFGLPPLEAMHFGKPVFLSDRTSLPEIGGDCAAYFKSFDPLAMRRCIELELPGLQARESEVRAHAAGFSWDRAAAAYLALYADRLGLTPPR